MNSNYPADKFTVIGARLKKQLTEARRWQEDHYAIDIRRDRHDERLASRLPQSARDTLDLTVLPANKRDRHSKECWSPVLPRIAQADRHGSKQAEALPHCRSRGRSIPTATLEETSHGNTR
jgi:hypothetical protein